MPVFFPLTKFYFMVDRHISYIFFMGLIALVQQYLTPQKMGCIDLVPDYI